jgi:ribulose-phosphate 3-epimerase
MQRPLRIAPSILAADFSRLGEEVKAVEVAGADLINVHAEAVPDVAKTVAHIRALGKKAAVALRPASPIDVVLPVLADLHMVLVMTVNPGFSGQEFMEEVVPKIRALRAEIERRGLDVDIQVDGGINESTVTKVVEAGANVLVAGYGVYHAPNHDYAGAIAALRSAARG